jgi:hypothetical protein
MQDRYVGDIGDFGKYGLLRFLSGLTDVVADKPLRLGVVWYLVPNESESNDGSHISYLLHDRYRLRFCDPPLYDTLQGLVRQDARHVDAIEKSAVFPNTTLFHAAPLSFSKPSHSLKERLQSRSMLLRTALTVTKAADLVFFDPDNGLEVRSVARHERRGPKYAFLDELRLFGGRGQSVVIYQHLCRRKTAAQQIEDRLFSLRRVFPHAMVTALRYRRGSPLAFFIVASRHHQMLLWERIRRFASHPEWQKHFSAYTG